MYIMIFWVHFSKYKLGYWASILLSCFMANWYVTVLINNYRLNFVMQKPSKALETLENTRKPWVTTLKRFPKEQKLFNFLKLALCWKRNWWQSLNPILWGWRLEG